MSFSGNRDRLLLLLEASKRKPKKLPKNKLTFRYKITPPLNKTFVFNANNKISRSASTPHCFMISYYDEQGKLCKFYLFIKVIDKKAPFKNKKRNRIRSGNVMNLGNNIVLECLSSQTRAFNENVSIIKRFSKRKEENVYVLVEGLQYTLKVPSTTTFLYRKKNNYMTELKIDLS